MHKFVACLFMFASVSFAADFVVLRPLTDQIGQAHEKQASLASQLGLSALDTLEPLKQHTGFAGMEHTRFRQFHRGVPVWGEHVVVSRDAEGTIRRLYGRIAIDLERDLESVIPVLEEGEALKMMKARLTEGGTCRQVGLRK